MLNRMPPRMVYGICQGNKIMYRNITYLMILASFEEIANGLLPRLFFPQTWEFLPPSSSYLYC